ncbi:hypothetical protein [Bdellovibrio sp. HCB2-146]|uniref:hypothetical protein n=1 Tax=Bdellovibrio sp. HCB2-146 TaxID=3394362 RepID=UPI0039BC6D56
MSLLMSGSLYAADVPLDFQDNNQLIMAVSFEDGMLAVDGMDVYRAGTAWYVPLASFVEAMGLAITVSPALGQAEGFIIEEANTFKMDKATCTAALNKVSTSFDCGQVVTYDDEIYVNSRLIEQWFGVRLRFDEFAAEVIVVTERKFPKQLRRERDRNAESLSSRDNPRPEYPEQPIEDKKLGEGSFDQQLTLGQQKMGDDQESYFRHDTIAAIEVLGFETRGFLGGENDHITESALSISKKDPYANLLGPMRARSMEFVDLTLPSLPLITSSSRAKGFLVSSFPLNQPTSFSTKDFRGPLPSNWEVELYQNDILIGRRSASTATEYEFKEVTLYYGVNRFRLRFYGPQGQRKEEVQVINVGEQTAKPAESYYRFGSGTRVDKNDVLNTVLQFRHGLSSQLNAGLSYYQENNRDTLLISNYGLLEIGGSFSSFFGTLNFATSDDSGSATEVTLQAPFERFIFGVSHSSLSNFRSRLFNATETRLVEQLNKVNGNLNVYPFLPLRLDAEVSQFTYANGSESTEVKQRTSWQIAGSYWFNTFMSDSDSNVDYNGQLIMLIPVDRYEFRTTAEYTESVDLLSSSLDFRLSDKYSYGLEVAQDIPKDITSFRASLNRLFRYITLSAEVTSDTQSNYRAIGLISYSGTYNPRRENFEWSPRSQTSYGAVSARVFLDQNYDGIFNEGDLPLKDIAFRVNQNDVDTETDDRGEAVLLALPVHQETDISLSLRSLPDPYYRPVKTGVRLIPRPGQVCQLEFPIIIQSEISGLVQLQREKGLRGLRNVTVQLKTPDGKVIASTKTESDGFYLIEGIFPGDYLLTVDTEQAEFKKIKFQKLIYPVHVAKSGLQESTFDFLASYERLQRH